MSVTILGQLAEEGVKLPFLSSQVPACVQLSAERLEKPISLDELFDIRTPDVCLFKVKEDSMQGVGIHCGDLVIVDRSLYAEHDNIVVASLNCEPVCKRLHMRDGLVILKSENSNYPPRHILEGDDLVIWGVVKYSVRDHDKALLKERQSGRAQHR